MPFTVDMSDPTIVSATVSGKLTHQDYLEAVPRLDRAIAARGPLRLLFELAVFDGWEARGAWDDLAFELRNYNSFERVAVVGDRRWEAWMTNLFRPFVNAEVRFFDRRAIGAARAWLRAPAAPTVPIWRRRATVPLPELGLIAATRAMLGAGIALLLAGRIAPRRRRAVGWTLAAIGVLTTPALIRDAFGRHTEDPAAPQRPGSREQARAGPIARELGNASRRGVV